MKARRKVGYFGGTFDPPHLGHIILAVEARHQLELDSLEWILTPDPPHKNGQVVAPQKYRLEMLQLAIAGYPDFKICTVDIERQPPHYAADTVETLKNDHPADELVYIIGEDSLRDLAGWVAPGRFLAALDRLAVAPRPGVTLDLDQLEKDLPGLKVKMIWLSDVMVEISSSLIRERKKAGAPCRHLLPDAVAGYLEKYPIYD